MTDFDPYEYTDRETKFLQLVEGSGGFFTRAQYDRFAGVMAGGPSGRLVNRGMGFGHIWRLDTGKKDRVYQWLGLDRELKKKVKSATIIRSLMALDFVLAHHAEYRFWLSDAAKATFIASVSGLPVPLPVRLGNDPLFTPDGVTAGFCYVDHERVFSDWMENLKPLISAIPAVQIVYLGGSARRIAAAQTAVTSLGSLLRDVPTIKRYLFFEKHGAAGLSDPELVEYRQLKQAFKRLPVRERKDVDGIIDVNCLTFVPAAVKVANKYSSFFRFGLCSTLRAAGRRLKARVVSGDSRVLVEA